MTCPFREYELTLYFYIEVQILSVEDRFRIFLSNLQPNQILSFKYFEMEMFLYFMIFFSFFHTMWTKKIENPACQKYKLPDNLEVYDCHTSGTDDIVICDARCKIGYKLKGNPTVRCLVDEKRWKGDYKFPSCIENIVCEMKMLPDNLEVYDCEDEDDDEMNVCQTRCKLGYKLKGPRQLSCMISLKKWEFRNWNPSCIKVDVECPYPPRLIDNLTVKECIETNGKKSNCTLSCENKKYRYMNGDKEIFCNFRTGKWVQEKSTHIATTCQQEFDCKFCGHLRCPSKTNIKCGKFARKCSCSCPDWDSCDGFKCPKDKPESFCAGITNKPGHCACRKF